MTCHFVAMAWPFILLIHRAEGEYSSNEFTVRFQLYCMPMDRHSSNLSLFSCSDSILVHDKAPSTEHSFSISYSSCLCCQSSRLEDQRVEDGLEFVKLVHHDTGANSLRSTFTSHDDGDRSDIRHGNLEGSANAKCMDLIENSHAAGGR